MRSAIVGVLVLAGCPSARYPEWKDAPILDGEGVEWAWGEPVCSATRKRAYDTTTSSFDARGRMTSQTMVQITSPTMEHPGTWERELRRGYDLEGRLLIEDVTEDGARRITRYRYSDDGRGIETRTIDDPGDTAWVEPWEYDPAGRLIQRGIESWTWARNQQGDRLTEYYGDLPGFGRGFLSWRYEDDGRVAETAFRTGVWGDRVQQSLALTWQGPTLVRGHHVWRSVSNGENSVAREETIDIHVDPAGRPEAWSSRAGGPGGDGYEFEVTVDRDPAGALRRWSRRSTYASGNTDVVEIVIERTPSSVTAISPNGGHPYVVEHIDHDCGPSAPAAAVEVVSASTFVLPIETLPDAAIRVIQIDPDASPRTMIRAL